MILHITDATLAGPTSISVRFSDGCSAIVDLRPLLVGPIFEPLLDPRAFAELTLDPVCKTICWPNGVDLAPEAIRAMVPTEQEILGQPSDAPERRWSVFSSACELCVRSR
jgi:hypothetical protein